MDIGPVIITYIEYGSMIKIMQNLLQHCQNMASLMQVEFNRGGGASLSDGEHMALRD